MNGKARREERKTNFVLAGGQSIKRLTFWPLRAAVVGVVDSSEALAASRRAAGRCCDFLEWRADRMGVEMPDSKLPWIITARHPAEGGFGGLSEIRRRKILLELLRRATCVDVEVRSLDGMAEVLHEARSRGVRIIASFHDFKKTPSVAEILKKIRSAKERGADIAKVATLTSRPADLVKLLEVLEKSPLPLSIMGMGRLGMASRVLFSSCGSVLNYGWLNSASVSGQWSVHQLRGMLDAMASGKDRR